MRSKLLSEGPPHTFAVVFDTGEEVVEGLTRFSRENGLSASALTGIGAFSEAVLGFFDVETRDDERIPVTEPVEVVAFLGDVALVDGEAKLHPHVVVSRRDGTALGGHLMEARVRPTLEVVLTEHPAHLRRRHDEATGLPLIDIGASP